MQANRCSSQGASCDEMRQRSAAAERVGIGSAVPLLACVYNWRVLAAKQQQAWQHHETILRSRCLWLCWRCSCLVLLLLLLLVMVVLPLLQPSVNPDLKF
jgi:hypothetical protein